MTDFQDRVYNTCADCHRSVAIELTVGETLPYPKFCPCCGSPEIKTLTFGWAR